MGDAFIGGLMFTFGVFAGVAIIGVAALVILIVWIEAPFLLTRVRRFLASDAHG